MSDNGMPLFGEALIALGGHMLANPDLPRVASIGSRYYTGHEYVDGVLIQLSSGLVAWAQTLLDVTSEARVGKSGSVFGYMYGHIGAVPVCAWAELPAAAFPSEPGVYEWDVRVGGES